MLLRKKSILALVAALTFMPVLAGCETVVGWTDSMKGADHMKVTNNTGATQVNQLLPPSAATDVYSEKELIPMTRKLSGGSVELFDLDETAPLSSIPSVERIGSLDAGVLMPNNSSVTVYPLDGGYNPGASWADGMTSRPVIDTGFGGSAITPPPVNFDDNTPLPTGKLSSSAGEGVSRIYFPYGSANLDGSDKRVLKDVAETAKFAPVDRVSVEGHASAKTQAGDPITARMLNLKESMNRAYEVSRELIDKGVPAEKIKTVGWGDTKPAGGNEPNQRRVDIVTAPGAGQ